LRVISTQDTVILGRRTYDEWAEFWPESDIEPFASLSMKFQVRRHVDDPEVCGRTRQSRMVTLMSS